MGRSGLDLLGWIQLVFERFGGLGGLVDSVVNQPAALLDAFLPHFLRGYRGENLLDPRWLAEIPTFLKLREIDLYAEIHRSMTAEEIAAYPWCAGFMANRKERIIESIPYVNYDWNALAALL